MIITIKGDRTDIFKDSNIGTLNTWCISRILGRGATYNGDTNIDKNARFEATVTLAEGYKVGADGVTVSMGGVNQGGGVYSISGNVITIVISCVTGNIIIKVPTEVDKSCHKFVDYLEGYFFNEDTGWFYTTTAPRALTSNLIKVNAGDSIICTNDEIDFRCYAYSDEFENSLVGCIGDWSKSLTFSETLTSNKGVDISYPAYVRLEFKSDTSQSVLQSDIRDYMIYNVADIKNTTTLLNMQIEDATGKLTLVPSSNIDKRAIMPTLVKVNAGDSIVCTNDNLKFILYAWSDTTPSSFVGYVDSNPEDSTSSLKNWGKSFTFPETLTSGSGINISYPAYVRLTLRNADGNSTMSYDDINNCITINTAETVE